jgi:hypothetical protein
MDHPFRFHQARQAEYVRWRHPCRTDSIWQSGKSNHIFKREDCPVLETAKATITACIRIHGRWRSQKDEYNIRSDFKEDSSLRDEDEQEIWSKYILHGGEETTIFETVNSDIEIRKLKK